MEHARYVVSSIARVEARRVFPRLWHRIRDIFSRDNTSVILYKHYRRRDISRPRERRR